MPDHEAPFSPDALASLRVIAARYSRLSDDSSCAASSTPSPRRISLTPWLNVPIPGNVDLIFFHGEVRRGNSPILVFDLADGGIDDVVSALAAAGATIVTPVSHAPGGWSADFSDPDGYTLSMYQSAQKPR